MHVFFFVTEDHDDWLIASPANEICGKTNICVGAEAQAECSGYVRSLTRGVCPRYQVSGDKY